MIKIALCDDDSPFVCKITGLIQSLLQNSTDSPVITTYINPTALMDAISDGERYDVYILDVEMPEQNGLEVAKHILQFQPNAALLFLSSHLNYATEGYKVQALRYVPKLDLENALPEALEQALATLEKRIPVLLWCSTIRIIPASSIRISSMSRKCSAASRSSRTGRGTLRTTVGTKSCFPKSMIPALSLRTGPIL